MFGDRKSNWHPPGGASRPTIQFVRDALKDSRGGSADDLACAYNDNRPDLVLFDMGMPEKSPFDALAELGEMCGQTRAIMSAGMSGVM